MVVGSTWLRHSAGRIYSRFRAACPSRIAPTLESVETTEGTGTLIEICFFEALRENALFRAHLLGGVDLAANSPMGRAFAGASDSPVRCVGLAGYFMVMVRSRSAFAVVPDGVSRTPFHGFDAKCFLLRGSRLLEDIEVAALVAAFEMGGGSLAAQVAVNALLIDGKLSGHVFRVLLVRSAMDYIWFHNLGFTSFRGRGSAFGLRRRSRRRSRRRASDFRKSSALEKG